MGDGLLLGMYMLSSRGRNERRRNGLAGRRFKLCEGVDSGKSGAAVLIWRKLDGAEMMGRREDDEDEESDINRLLLDPPCLLPLPLGVFSRTFR